MKPRIYIYKITFEETPEWYYGRHREKKYDEHYMGSPVTYKEFWRKFTPKKEILLELENNKDNWFLASIIESSLIKADWGNPLCLNKNYGGFIDSRDPLVRAKLSASWDKPGRKESLSDKMKKAWGDPSYREKVSESISRSVEDLWKNPEYREKVSRGVSKLWEEEGYRENCSKKMSEIMKTRWEDPEFLRARSERQKERWEDHEYRDKVTASRREPEFREKASSSMLEKWKDPAYRSSRRKMMWITDGTKEGSKMVPAGEEIPAGFRKGRVSR